MPNPEPDIDDTIRAAWNDSAPYSQWITELGGDHAIVVDDTDRALYRVPVLVGEAVEFGDPEPVDPDAAGTDGRTVFASRAESRPDVAAGIDGDNVAAHLPGRHTQSSHANRYRTPGDRSSGLVTRTRTRTAPTPRTPSGPAPRETDEARRARQDAEWGRSQANISRMHDDVRSALKTARERTGPLEDERAAGQEAASKARTREGLPSPTRLKRMLRSNNSAERDLAEAADDVLRYSRLIAQQQVARRNAEQQRATLSRMVAEGGPNWVITELRQRLIDAETLIANHDKILAGHRQALDVALRRWRRGSAQVAAEAAEIDTDDETVEDWPLIGIDFLADGYTTPEGEPAVSDQPPTDPAPTGPPVVDDPTPPNVPPPVEPAATPEPPAAEPEQPSEPTDEEDRVSTLSTDVRSRLGLPEDADDAAVLAALDDVKAKADQQPSPEQVAASVAADQRREELEKEVKVLASQVETMSSKLAAAEQEKAATVKASVLDEAVKQGKIKPADRDQWAKDYDEAPGAITRVLASIAPGTAVPVMASGETTNPDQGVDIDAEWAQVSHLYPAETVKEG